MEEGFFRGVPFVRVGKRAWVGRAGGEMPYACGGGPWEVEPPVQKSGPRSRTVTAIPRRDNPSETLAPAMPLPITTAVMARSGAAGKKKGGG